MIYLIRIICFICLLANTTIAQQTGGPFQFNLKVNRINLNRTDCFSDDIDFNNLPPRCNSCGGLIKPDFIFFGEGIPQEAYAGSFHDASNAEVMIVIGTTGEIMPASQLPYLAKQNGAIIIEVNKEPSKYTGSLTDIFLQGKATEVMGRLGGVLSI